MWLFFKKLFFFRKILSIQRKSYKDSTEKTHKPCLRFPVINILAWYTRWTQTDELSLLTKTCTLFRFP